MSEDLKENTSVINEPEPETEEVKPKKKFVFAKNRSEAIWAIIVMVIFFANTAYVIFKYIVNQN